ncbi:hypothetical protein OH799_03860 [Nocardia sp. NBC_00881]|uniref:hypothetical protein n=1 Tax=Nocardia sp. NBC_00881 TaxID=2975995 RepID=UPI0038708E43|nr:hypothetical protein OH799_03860 [Nocardia sp. NBC_00881]
MTGDVAVLRACGILVLLTVTDIEQADGETYLRLGDATVLLPAAAAAVFHALAATTTARETFHRTDPNTRYLFPGRSPGRPAAAHILARKLRAHGIRTLTSRNSARAAWAHDIPSPIAADLLGIDISTATRWAQRTRRGWTDYLATRAADHLRTAWNSASAPATPGRAMSSRHRGIPPCSRPSTRT